MKKNAIRTGNKKKKEIHVNKMLLKFKMFETDAQVIK